ncbi:RNA-directed DNA polymerase, eukaryota [Tanacetum coccineum]
MNWREHPDPGCLLAPAIFHPTRNSSGNSPGSVGHQLECFREYHKLIFIVLSSGSIGTSFILKKKGLKKASTTTSFGDDDTDTTDLPANDILEVKLPALRNHFHSIVDFAKAYDSVRWDYLLDILHAFGFGPNWCRWIRGTFTSSMASILVNGSPTSEFPFCYGLKQGDPLAPYLFILIMESLHISFSVLCDGLFKDSSRDRALLFKILVMIFLRINWDKEIVVANKMSASSVSASFAGRGLVICREMGEFKVKVSETLLMTCFSLSRMWHEMAVEVFCWIPICVLFGNAAMEDVQHVFFRCDVARVVLSKICRWWDLDWQEIWSYRDWDAWFLSFDFLPSQVYFRTVFFMVCLWQIWRDSKSVGL